MPALVPGEVSYAGLPVPPGAVIILAAAAGLVWEDQRNIAIGNRIRTRAASKPRLCGGQTLETVDHQLRP